MLKKKKKNLAANLWNTCPCHVEQIGPPPPPHPPPASTPEKNGSAKKKKKWNGATPGVSKLGREEGSAALLFRDAHVRNSSATCCHPPHHRCAGILFFLVFFLTPLTPPPPKALGLRLRPLVAPKVLHGCPNSASTLKPRNAKQRWKLRNLLSWAAIISMR